jgi:putative ATP-binding cassette transporter
MLLLKFVFRSCRRMVVFTTLAAILSGACNAALVALVSTALTEPLSAFSGLMWPFIAVGLGKLLSNYASQVMLVRFSQGAIARLRRDLIRQVLAVPLRQLEELGSARILVALTDDVFNITQALLGIPVITVNLAMLLGGAAYLGWLSWRILLCVGGLILVGGFGYRLVVGRAFRYLNLAREAEDRLFTSFRALTEGIKELKLHRRRRGAYYANVESTTDIYQRHNVTAENCFIIAQSWNHFLYFALIGLILFLVPHLAALSRHTLTGYVVTTLYLMGPLAGVMSSFSLFGRASIALQKVQQLGISLAEHSNEACSFEQQETPLTFERLQLTGVLHSYHSEKDDSHFVLGPINLAFRRGEVVFLVGGNGSGKSTLAKLIAGLYVPEQGEIRLDGRPITNENRDQYRQLFAAVFSDFYLFDQLLGLESPGLDAQAAEYLEALHLQYKVKINNGALSTTALSQGQRKRLALLTAYLEDRPFYLFDEWAADQDPHFKRVFYTQLLPDLKARGKTVLVITHDDHYFHLADRLLKLDYGKLVQPLPEAEEQLLGAPA